MKRLVAYMAASCALFFVFISSADAVESPYPHKGFHFSMGLGGSFEHGYCDEPGILTQIKIGAGISDNFRLFYYQLHHWFNLAHEYHPDEWRAAAIHGLGMDYFFLKNLGFRFALGLGADLHVSGGDDHEGDGEVGKYNNAFGFAFAFGMTIELFEGAHHLTLDPMVNIIQFDFGDVRESLGNWQAVIVVGITANYGFR